MCEQKNYNKNFHYNNALKLLESDCIQSLRYACLELRYLIEAHVYERLLHEVDDLPRSIINTWQPNKAIKMLSMFDDLADKDMRLELLDSDGNVVTKIHCNNIPIKELNKIYNSLGSYLHLPMPRKVDSYKIDKGKISDILRKLKRVTDGNLIIYKIHYDYFKCENCNKNIIYTEQYVKNNDSIKCQNDNCNIEYVIRTHSKSVEFGAKYEFECGVCHNQASVFFSKIEDGYAFSCDSCNTKYTFELILRGDSKDGNS